MRSAYAAHNTNPETVRRSSSGGIFSLLAAHVLNEGGRVYGAACDENGRISYRGISRTAEIPELCGSKYVFVPIAPVMDEIADLVKDGQTVLAVVSPCQAAALRRACGDSGRLILVDFICHGAPPAEFWEKYRAECAQDHGAAVTGVNFRRKIPGMDWQSYEVELRYADGTVERRRAVDDPYMQTFLRNASLRKACAVCAAKGENRASDLTLGDFWGIERTDLAPLNDDKGASLVFAASEKGRNAVKALATSGAALVENLQLPEPFLRMFNPNILYDNARPKERAAVMDAVGKYEGMKLLAALEEILPRLFQ